MVNVWSIQLVTLMSLWSLSTAQYANTFYITPNASTTSCPGNPCYELKIYLQNASYYFQSNTQFIFLPGVHTFDTGFPLVVEGKENISLVGSYNFTQHSVDEKVMEYGFDPYDEDVRITFAQSASIILCSGKSGFHFLNMVNISLINVSLLNCGKDSPGRASIYMSNISNLLMDGVSIQNSIGYGFFGKNLLGQSNIVRSSFIANNQYVKVLLLKTSVGSLRCNGVDLDDKNIAYLNNGSMNCSAIIGGNMVLEYDDSPYVLSFNQLSLSQLLFILGVDGSFGYQCDMNMNHGTGLSIKVAQSTFNVSFDIQNSTFYRNQANEGASINFHFHTASNSNVNLKNISLIRGIAFSGGAGVKLTMNTQSNSLSMITATSLMFECNCVMENAKHRSTFDIAINSGHSQLSNSRTLIQLNSNHFSSNMGMMSLGIFFNTLLTVNIVYNSSVEIVDCTFMDSQYSVYAQSDYAIKPIVLFHKSCTTKSNVWLDGIHFNIVNVTFANSTLWALNSAIEYNGNIICKGRSSVENGGALHLSSSSAVFAQNSNVMFINNTAIFGGAIFIDSQSTLIFTSPCNVSFLNNEALLEGGALYIQRGLQSGNYTSPPCFFKINNTAGISIGSSFGVHVYFEGNSAGEAGSVLYGGDIDHCTLNTSMLPFPYTYAGNIASGELFDNITVFGHNDNSSSLISSDPILFKLCYNAISSSNWINYTGYPGQSINLSFFTMGQRGSITPAVVVVYTIYPIVKIFKVLYTDKSCSTYSILYGMINKTLMFTTELALLGNIQNTNDTSIKLSITVNLTCPNGFKLDSSIPSCMCSSLLQTYGFECNIKNETVLTFGNEWIGYSQDHLLGVVAQCPFDYCSDNKSISIHDYDSQCNYNRSKVLCGQCKGNLSMVFGTSQCAKCSNYYLFLVVPFAIMGVVLVALLFILNLTVISGTLNGIIFYANIFRINENIFIPAIRTTGYIQFITIPIAWLNLDFGIETCFYNGMDSIAKSWLQFVFPIYILSLVSLMILVGRYSSIVARLKAAPVFATLILLSYSKLVRTIITIFSYFPINAPNSSVSDIWIYDGNVRLFEGAHLALFIFGLFVTIIFIIPYTFLLLLAPLLQSRSHWYGCHWINKFKPFLDCYYAPFKDRYRFWSGILPIIRIPLYLVFMLSENTTLKLWVIIIVTHFYVIALITLSVFKKWFVSLLEVFLLVNISVICVVALNNPFNNVISQDIIITLVTLSLFVILGILGYHAVKNKHLKRCVIRVFRKCMTQSTSDEEKPLLVSDASIVIPAEELQDSSGSSLREPLLEY